MSSFLELERELFRTLTPAWRDARLAEHQARVEPPPVAPMPGRLCRDLREFPRRPPVRLKQVMEVAATLAQPGEEMSLKRIAEASGIPLCTVYYVTRPARADGSWPYTTKDRRKARASPEPPSR